jgi:hypothetical protein
MKRILLNLVFVALACTIFSCAPSIPQHCPSYSQSYHKVTLKKTKGVNTNEFANGIKPPRVRHY